MDKKLDKELNKILSEDVNIDEYDKRVKKSVDKQKNVNNNKKNKLNITDLEKISKLENTVNINTTNYLSDSKFIKNVDKIKWYQLIKKIKRRLKPQILIIIHRPDNQDMARYFPITKNHVIDIDGQYHMFNPQHFRYINGQPVLYFYYGNPFSKIINVNDGYVEPTISSEAFTSVLTSKFVIDAVKGEQGMKNILWVVIALILVFVLIVLSIINIIGINNVTKILQP